MKKFISLTLSILATAIFFTGCGEAGDGDITEGTTESLTETTTTMDTTNDTTMDDNNETTTMQTGSEETNDGGLIDEGKDNLEEGMDKAESKMSDMLD